MTPIIIWGKGYETKEKVIRVYEGKNEIYYTHIENELVHYHIIKEQSELEKISIHAETLIVCTNHLERYNELIDLLAGKKRGGLLFIPHIKDVEEALFLAYKIATDQIEEGIGRFCIALGGKGRTTGEVSMEILKHLYLFKQITSYELLLKVPSSRMMVSLAEIEDVLSEYVDEQSELLLTPWEREREADQEVFYLLRGKK